MSREYSGERPWRRVSTIYTMPAPAAGADFTITVPAGKLWDVVVIYATLTTAVAVASREADITFGDGNALFASVGPAAVQAASLADRYLWAVGLTNEVAGSSQSQAIPSLRLLPGWTIASVTANIQAADQWSAQKLYVVETTLRGGDINFEDVPELMVELAMMPQGMSPGE